MNIPLPEKRRVRSCSGRLPAGQIGCLAACHPFSQQLDVILPSDHDSLLEALENLKTSYGKGKTKLSNIINNANAFATLLMLSVNAHEDDIWCIDPRGHLTLSVSKETYERLGLVGKRLPFKIHDDRHVIDMALFNTAESTAVQAKRKTVLEDWDKRREVELGDEAGPWEVLYCSTGNQMRQVRCERTELKDVHMPLPTLSSQPRAQPTKKSVEEEEALEDWNRKIGELFEWVGMACLGAQRLYANDRVDPYVCVYESPTPSRIHNVTHLRWRGLLCPNFVQEVLDTITVTCHALPTSPVSYIPYTMTENGSLQLSDDVPARFPRADGEDTWSLILESETGDAAIRWVMVESLGQWDARWG
ncbi:hypothetical protein BYT27DRAFT_7222422 [Phlegmacium glaucopus]|nr:hypothetical protein BYT27DRAFT_7222422 [Phlegmacium glaucopus]